MRNLVSDTSTPQDPTIETPGVIQLQILKEDGTPDEEATADLAKLLSDSGLLVFLTSSTDPDAAQVVGAADEDTPKS